MAALASAWEFQVAGAVQDFASLAARARVRQAVKGTDPGLALAASNVTVDSGWQVANAVTT